MARKVVSVVLRQKQDSGRSPSAAPAKPEGYRRGATAKAKRQRVKRVVKDGLLQLDTTSQTSSSPALKTLGGK